MTNPLTPYLAVHDAAAAIDFYARALGAVEVMRVVGDDGRVGHAEITIGGASVYLSDEYPEIGVESPRSIGNTAVSLHLGVADVDATFATSVELGATSLTEPADQPHGARHGTLLDPFGHRWMLSQAIETVDVDTYEQRLADDPDSGFAVTRPSDAAPATSPGGIWAAVHYADAPAGIRFLVDVVGFTEEIIVPGEDPSVVEHSQLRWPEGGVVQAVSARRADHDSVFSGQPTGAQSLYVITADPMAVHQRCVTAGIEVAVDPHSPEYDPSGTVFTVRDAEGNLWSFGTYAGEGVTSSFGTHAREGWPRRSVPTRGRGDLGSAHVS